VFYLHPCPKKCSAASFVTQLLGACLVASLPQKVQRRVFRYATPKQRSRLQGADMKMRRVNRRACKLQTK